MPSSSVAAVVVACLVAVAGCGGDHVPKVCAGEVAAHSLDVDDLCTADEQCRWPVCHQGYCAAQCDVATDLGDRSFECNGVGVSGSCGERVVDGMPYLGCAYLCATDKDCPTLADGALSCADGLCVAPSCEQLGH